VPHVTLNIALSKKQKKKKKKKKKKGGVVQPVDSYLLESSAMEDVSTVAAGHGTSTHS